MLEKNRVRLNAAAKKELGVKVLNCEKQLHKIDSAMKRGELSSLDLLKEKLEKTKVYIDVNTVITKYQQWYASAKPGVKPGTNEGMKVECTMLLEVLGNISIDSFNSMDSITQLKTTLQKYPKNRFQRFGLPSTRSIRSVLKDASGYEKMVRRSK